MELALTKEINRQYVEAVQYYEAEIANEELHSSPNSYINLAFLYWSFAFDYFGFDVPNDIPDDYSIVGGNRYPEILNKGIEMYPNNVELQFWKRYFPHIIYGEEFSENDCIMLIEKFKNDGSIVPYFFLAIFDSDKYVAEKKELLNQCEKFPTAKNLYIKSMLE